MRDAFDWPHGVFLAATMSSEQTAAANRTVGELRFDPFAMLPFCGYNMADYFAHWLQLGRRKGAKLPKIFYVNWFRKDADGEFPWPGYGENSRVLAWVFRRCDNAVRAELPQIREHLAQFAERLRAQLRTQLTRTERQLNGE